MEGQEIGQQCDLDEKLWPDRQECEEAEDQD